LAANDPVTPSPIPHTPKQKPEDWKKIREDMEAAMAEEVVAEDP
jgi:hypothetical protein